MVIDRNSNNIINFLGIGKYSHQKNIINLIKALDIVRNDQPNIKIKLDWYGDNFTKNITNLHLNKVNSLIHELKLEKIICLNPTTHNILQKYQASSALILPSYSEGLPNAACEAISCGLPLIISDVCDNKILVDKLNGYLFDPYNPKDIAEKIISFCKKNNEEKNIMSKNRRIRAENLFDENNYINNHLKIISSI